MMPSAFSSTALMMYSLCRLAFLEAGDSVGDLDVKTGLLFHAAFDAFFQVRQCIYLHQNGGNAVHFALPLQYTATRIGRVAQFVDDGLHLARTSSLTPTRWCTTLSTVDG